MSHEEWLQLRGQQQTGTNQIKPGEGEICLRSSSLARLEVSVPLTEATAELKRLKSTPLPVFGLTRGSGLFGGDGIIFSQCHHLFKCKPRGIIPASAKSFGADGTYLPPKPEQGTDPVQHSEKVAELIKKEFDLGEGPDVVIEATGAEPCTTTSTAGLFAFSRKLTVCCRYSGGCQFDKERRCKHDLHLLPRFNDAELTFQ